MSNKAYDKKKKQFLTDIFQAMCTYIYISGYFTNGFIVCAYERGISEYTYMSMCAHTRVCVCICMWECACINM